VAGEIVDHFGYSPTFLSAGAAAAVAFAVFFLFMPETAGRETLSPQSRVSLWPEPPVLRLSSFRPQPEYDSGRAI